MSIPNRKESLVLLFGDIVAFIVSLWLALTIRTGALPESSAFFDLLLPFSFLFLLWVASFFIAGLYEKQRIAQRSRLPELLFKTEIWNSLVAVIFFYTVPYFGVEPKTILFIYIILSLLLTFLWRIYALSFFDTKDRGNALLIGNGEDAEEVRNEINHNPRFSFIIRHVIATGDRTIDFQKDILEKVHNEHIEVIIIDSQDEKVAAILPELYGLLFSKVQFFDLYTLYEETFDRVPVSLLRYGWFIENISLTPKAAYDFFKRCMDIAIAIPISLIALLATPLVFIGIKIQDGGPVLFKQRRVGKNGEVIQIIKFRSMTNVSGVDLTSDDSTRVTRFGAFLRTTRIDELPQAWNLLKGDLSFIGPRPEIPALVEQYEKTIPYYGMRHVIKPGLSGWAQLYHENHPHHGAAVEETKEKLSYDLFYIKNRSFALDVVIALKTIKALLSRQGK